MKRLFLLLFAAASLSMAGATSVNAALLNGYWHNSDLKVLVSGKRANVNGQYVKIKQTSANHWRSVANKSSQPFSLVKSGNKLTFISGMDKEVLHK